MGSGRRPYPPEVKERAVRLVYEWRAAREQDFGGFYEIGEQLGIHGESIRNWMRQGEIDGGSRDGVTTSERSRLVELERENRELRRANEILKSQRLFSRGSSTRNRGGSRLHRRAPGGVRGRADLHRVGGRPIHLLRVKGPPAVPAPVA